MISIKKNNNSNSRNGYRSKIIKTHLGETQIQVPRDRDAPFNPTLIKKLKSTADSAENFIISLYTKGMSTTDIEEQIREFYDFNISSSAI